MDASLPYFGDPPVVEVALAVQFEPLAELRTPQIGLFWNEIRERFPKIEEHPPLGTMMERFGARRKPIAGVRIEMMQQPPLPRCWFLNEAGTELIQIQKDRFAQNWRKTGGDEEYPRYDHLRETFESELRQFEDFLRRERIGAIVANQCEVTYVNHIVAGRGWDTHGDLANVLSLFGGEPSEGFLPDMEEARLSGSYIIPDGDGPPLGRLRFSIDPVYRREDDQPMFLLNMVARGRPDGDGTDGVLRFLDTGHTWIVRGFAAITTPHMHKIWRR